MPKQTLKPAEQPADVAYVKRLLWEGRSQTHIAALCGVSQGFVSRVRSGTLHADVQWPDGSTGGLRTRLEHDAQAATPNEEGWSTDATRFLTFPSDMQVRILQIVNDRRRELGMESLPQAATAYQDMLQMDAHDAAFEHAAVGQARLEEDRRLTTIMREFDGLLTEQVAVRSDEAALAILQRTRASAPQVLIPQAADTMEYDKLPWAFVSQVGGSLTIVRKANTSADALLKEACCVIFHHLRNSPSAWQLPEATEQIVKLRERLAQFPRLVASITEEYKNA